MTDKKKSADFEIDTAHVEATSVIINQKTTLKVRTQDEEGKITDVPASVVKHADPRMTPLSDARRRQLYTLMVLYRNDLGPMATSQDVLKAVLREHGTDEELGLDVPGAVRNLDDGTRAPESELGAKRRQAITRQLEVFDSKPGMVPFFTSQFEVETLAEKVEIEDIIKREITSRRDGTYFDKKLLAEVAEEEEITYTEHPSNRLVIVLATGPLAADVRDFNKKVGDNTFRVATGQDGFEKALKESKAIFASVKDRTVEPNVLILRASNREDRFPAVVEMLEAARLRGLPCRVAKSAIFHYGDLTYDNYLTLRDEVDAARAPVLDPNLDEMDSQDSSVINLDAARNKKTVR